MAVDYTPTLKPYENVGAFRYWCQTTLPLVYDDSKSYLELLYSVIHYLNSTISDVADMGDNIDSLLEAYNQLQGYVNDYFDNLDVQAEINAKLDGMASDGTLDNLLEPFVQSYVGDWLEENLTPTTPPIDNTLTIENAAADAKAVGDAIANMVKPYGTVITPAYIEAHTEFQNAKTIPSNYVYNFNNYVNGSIANFPTDTVSIFTLTKLNGTGRTAGGFSEYLLVGNRPRRAYMYYGFDIGSEIRWVELDAQDFYRISDTNITEAWYSDNPGKTIIDLPFNRTYHGRLETNYAEFGLPDGNSFTLAVFSPFESFISQTTPSIGFTLYLYTSYISTSVKTLYYCLKSTNETVAGGDLRWFKVPTITDIENVNPSDVRPYGTIITPAYIEAHTEFQNVRTMPSNYVYDFNNYVNGSVANLPTDTVSIFTLTKLNGAGRGVGGFSEYLLVGNRPGRAYMYYGFDTGSEVRWGKLDPQEFYRISDTNITEAWYSDNPGKTIIDLPLNRTYHGRLETNYAEFGLPDGNSFTLAIFSPYESSRSQGTPSVGHSLYLYASYTSTNVKELYYAFKSVNETVGNGTLRWFKVEQGVKKRYLFIGDSYAEGYSHDGRNDGWCEYCVGYMGLSENDYVISYLGGSSFSGGSKFVNLLGDYGASAFSDVVVCGGYNDNSHTDTEITSAISTFVTQAKAKYPYAKVHIGFIAYNKEGNGEGAISTWETIRTALLDTVLPAYQKGAQYGAQYLNNVEYWLNEEGLTNSDGYHPSALGNQRIGMAVANALLTGSAPLPYHDNLRLGAGT